MGEKIYASFKHYMAIFDGEAKSFTFLNEKHGARCEMQLEGLFATGERKIDFSDFASYSISRKSTNSEREIVVSYRHKDVNAPKAEVCVRVDSRGITLVAREIDQYEFRAVGHIYLGNSERLQALSTKNNSDTAFRSSIGPASSKGDNAVYDSERDIAFCIDNCQKLKLAYDWDKCAYGFSIKTKSEGVAEYIRFYVKEGLLSDTYNIDYKPLRARGKFDAPPAGWMTWYAVKFGACEESVLRNLAFQRDHLKDFGANTVWVDWEWCHRRYERERDDGVNNLVPDKEKYPRGLGFIADKIKDAGFRSALWVGATNDISFSDFEAENPGVSLAHNETWSGLYYYDITSEEYLNGYLPRVMGQIRAWGYDAVKFDTLPNCIMAHEQFHGNMAHPEQTTYTAYTNMLAKTRELLGEETFMLGCGGSQGAALWGIGYFDATRVGPDLFTWEKFCETVGLVREYYPLHNRAIMVDADNVVLRDEYSTMAEARSRLSLVSLLGLPLTFGDDLPVLPKERVDLLKRGLPVIKTYPAQLVSPISDGKTQLCVTKIEKPYESYTVIGLLNLSDTELTRELSFSSELKIENGEYLAYSFFDGVQLPIGDESVSITVAPHDTAVVAIKRKLDRPQIISTSRHLTQGAAELSDVSWDGKVLSLCAELVAQDEYRVTVHIPKGYTAIGASLGEISMSGSIAILSYTPERTGEHSFKIFFD